MLDERDHLDPRAIAFLAALAAGVALACATMPAIYRAVPSDLSRTGTIVRAIRGAEPRIVVFGDSRAEAAVDARRLGAHAMNLASPDQTLPEVLLLASLLPESVENVIVFITAEESRDPRPLPRPAANALWMSGFRPPTRVEDDLLRCTGSRPFVSPLRERYEARWVLGQVLDTSLRDALRPSLRLRHKRESLEFPSIYESRLAGARFDAGIEDIRTRKADVMHGSRRCVVATLHEMLQSRQTRLLLVIPPIHSEAIPPDYDIFTTSVASFSRERGIPLLDVSRSMPDEAFADARHLTWAGAEAFSLLLRGQALGDRADGTH